jgi:hypothetical protein
MPDGWRWPDDGRWACQLRQDAQHADFQGSEHSSPARPRAHQQGCHRHGPVTIPRRRGGPKARRAVRPTTISARPANDPSTLTWRSVGAIRSHCSSLGIARIKADLPTTPAAPCAAAELPRRDGRTHRHRHGDRRDGPAVLQRCGMADHSVYPVSEGRRRVDPRGDCREPGASAPDGRTVDRWCCRRTSST